MSRKKLVLFWVAALVFSLISVQADHANAQSAKRQECLRKCDDFYRNMCMKSPDVYIAVCDETKRRCIARCPK